MLIVFFKALLKQHIIFVCALKIFFDKHTTEVIELSVSVWTYTPVYPCIWG